MTAGQNDGSDGRSVSRLVGLVLGLVVFALMLLWFRADSLERPAEITAAVGVLMAVWWATDAIPVAATALLPLLLFPVAGVMTIEATAAPYASPIVFLFLGGFLVALAIERCGLHRRVALAIFQTVGRSGAGLVGGFMLVSASLSMWISNSSTALMLFPIATSLGMVVAETSPHLSAKEKKDFQIALLLGLAYGASIGGVATLVGTPTNAFMVGFLQSEYAIAIPFSQWLLVGLPVSFVMLPLGWLLLTRVLFPVHFVSSAEARRELKIYYDELGPMSRAERRTAALFAVLVVGWVLRAQIAAWTGLGGLTDAGIAIGAAILGFLIPSGTDNRALIAWEDTRNLPWGVIILFGGGMALAASLSSSGLTLWLGQQLSPLGAVNHVILIIVVTTLVIFLTELTSNVATTATLLPVVGALGLELGIDPLLFVVPVTIAASCAFMMPVATPPNAIVFSSGAVTISDMMRAGLILNLVGIVLISILALVLVPLIL